MTWRLGDVRHIVASPDKAAAGARLRGQGHLRRGHGRVGRHKRRRRLTVDARTGARDEPAATDGDPVRPDRPLRRPVPLGHRGLLAGGDGCCRRLPALPRQRHQERHHRLPARRAHRVCGRPAWPRRSSSAIQQSGTLVAVRDGGPADRPDQAAFDRLEAGAPRCPRVMSVQDASVSIDGQARTAVVQFSSATEGGGRRRRRRGRPCDPLALGDRPPRTWSVYLTGPLPELVDQQSAANHTASHVQLISARLHRPPPGAGLPIRPGTLGHAGPGRPGLGPGGTAHRRVDEIGVQVSSLMQLLLTALVLGAGTDYGLFLIFRYRGEPARGPRTRRGHRRRGRTGSASRSPSRPPPSSPPC